MAVKQYPEPPFPKQKQPVPGLTAKMQPSPDHGEESYKGSGRLKGKKAIITGADSGIGRAVALAYAREGADVCISYLSKKFVEAAGCKAVLVAGDVQEAGHCRKIIETAISALGGIDILVNKAAHQASFKGIADISDEEWELIFRVNIHAMFYLTKAAVAHMQSGSHHQYRIDQCRCTESDLTCLRDNEGCDSKLHGRPCAAACREGNSRQCGGAGTDLDTVDPVDTTRGRCFEFRQASAYEAGGTTGRTRNGLVMLVDPLSSYVSEQPSPSPAANLSSRNIRRAGTLSFALPISLDLGIKARRFETIGTVCFGHLPALHSQTPFVHAVMKVGTVGAVPNVIPHSPLAKSRPSLPPCATNQRG
jgi:NAD(P)-dependent dehydrogenase (short-subunit alcohol dehydrogenase family)